MTTLKVVLKTNELFINCIHCVNKRDVCCKIDNADDRADNHHTNWTVVLHISNGEHYGLRDE